MTALIRVSCLQCQSPFTTVAAKLKIGHGKFCSRRCSGLFHSSAAGERVRAAARAIRQHRSGEIHTASGYYIKVSPEDEMFLAQFNWGGVTDVDRYPRTLINRIFVPMHRMVVERKLARQLLVTEKIDHINRDRHDNRRENLRIASPSQNMANRAINKSNTTGYKGVCLKTRHGQFEANIKVNRQTFHIGQFPDAEWAAYMYDQWALALFGEFAWTNFAFETASVVERQS